MTSRSRRGPQELADRLREQIYLSFVALAVVLAMRTHGHVEVGAAAVTLAVTIVGTLMAVFTAEVIAHLIMHESLPTRAELRTLLFATFGAVGAVFIPFVFLGATALGWWDVDAALVASAVVLAVTLVLYGYVAVRRVPLTWWQRLIVLGGEAALGLVVIGLQIVAHG